ncbi:uncharacterized protein L3040_005082 [Drepanopeziza brunnea f. sp. 'multigermtubi']|uniref:uncharacterized protein n=1 Tax=Drepanopeziza brunnea f. sp. 'multigermtubi' TaxID=698441 RepID=UPI002385DFF8|nr:hypothetical protein L3040_005082 [Drepanopeziza brunnea f. sp. 'multigermtubi']
MPSRTAESMGYRHSTELPEDLWIAANCPTQFRPRISKHASIADDACRDIRADMVRAGASPAVVQGPGCINPVAGNAMALWFPEALPERLYIASFMIEFAFMHDDLADNAKTSEEFDERNRTLIGSLDDAGSDKRTGQSLALKSLQARFAVQALEMDAPIGSWLLEEWKRQFGVSSEERDAAKTLDEYLKLRLVDAGADIFLVMMRFVSDTDMTRAEIESVKYISDIIMYGHILWHDCVSWKKEFEAFASGNAGSLVNAIFIVQNSEDVDEPTAQKILYDKTLEYERRYCQERDRFMETCSPRSEFHRWFDLLELSTGGNALWGATSPRYHKTSPGPANGLGNGGEIASAHGNGDGHARAQEAVSPYSVIHSSSQAETGAKSSSSSPEGIERAGSEKVDESVCTPVSFKSDMHGHATARTGMSPSQLALAPYTYISSLPSKGARDKLIDALNVWYGVPETRLSIIRHVVGVLHHVSLMLDDIQDNSPLRRGFPSAHAVFGVSQTINAATYIYTKALQESLKLSPVSTRLLFDELEELHIGQALELHETFHTEPPSIPQYFDRIEQKTGGLFRAASKMMQAEATSNQQMHVDTLMSLLGRYYQIRDDHQDITNMCTGKSARQGDLDQGTFTLPVIHALEKQAAGHGSGDLRSLFQSRSHHGRMSPEMKTLVRRRLEEEGSLRFTKEVLDELHGQLQCELGGIEARTGQENWLLRLMMHRLKI